MDIRWSNETNLNSKEYTCGHCGKLVASDKGFFSHDHLEGAQAQIIICPHCARPTFFHKGAQLPDVAPAMMLSMFQIMSTLYITKPEDVFHAQHTHHQF